MTAGPQESGYSGRKWNRGMPPMIQLQPGAARRLFCPDVARLLQPSSLMTNVVSAVYPCLCCGQICRCSFGFLKYKQEHRRKERNSSRTSSVHRRRNIEHLARLMLRDESAVLHHISAARANVQQPATSKHSNPPFSFILSRFSSL